MYRVLTVDSSSSNTSIRHSSSRFISSSINSSCYHPSHQYFKSSQSTRHHPSCIASCMNRVFIVHASCFGNNALSRNPIQIFSGGDCKKFSNKKIKCSRQAYLLHLISSLIKPIKEIRIWFVYNLVRLKSSRHIQLRCDANEMVYERQIPDQSPREIFLAYARHCLTDLIRFCNEGCDAGYVAFRLEQLIEATLRWNEIEPLGLQLVEALSRALDLINDEGYYLDRRETLTMTTGQRGHPRFDVPKDMMCFLVEHGFTTNDISKMLSVSRRTVQRRMAEFDIREGFPRYSSISDVQLDSVIRDITNDFPNCGIKRMQGFLLERSIRVQWDRVRASMRRNDPEGVFLRSLQLNVVHRRVYSVRGPLSLWHLDGNHKLIR